MLLLVDPIPFGHHPWLVSHLHELFSKVGHTKVMVEQKKHAPFRSNKMLPFSMGFLCSIVLSIIRGGRSYKQHVILCWDEIWPLSIIIIIPYLIFRKNFLWVLMFRAGFLGNKPRIIDKIKELFFLPMRLLMGKRFRLLATRPDYQFRSWAKYFPDLLSHGIGHVEELPNWPLSKRVLLFIGSPDDERKGFARLSRFIEILPNDIVIAVQEPQNRIHRSKVMSNSGRFFLMPTRLTEDQKRWAFGHSAAVVMPYPTTFPGSSGVVNDAIMHYCPYISTPFPYARWFSSRFSVGRLVSFDSCEEIVDALESLILRDCSSIGAARKFLMQRQGDIIKHIVSIEMVK